MKTYPTVHTTAEWRVQVGDRVYAFTRGLSAGQFLRLRGKTSVEAYAEALRAMTDDDVDWLVDNLNLPTLDGLLADAIKATTTVPTIGQPSSSDGLPASRTDG